MDIETVTIHQVIDGIPREEQVPESTVDSWTAHGWLPGPFPAGDNRPAQSASKAVWLAYAQSLGFEFTDAQTKESLIAAVDVFRPAPIDVAESDTETSPVGETPTAPEEDHHG